MTNRHQIRHNKNLSKRIINPIMSIIAEILKLKHAQQNLEKSEVNCIKHINNFSQEFQLKNIYDDLNAVRERDVKKMHENAVHIWSSMHKVRENVQENAETNSDLNILKKQMIGMQMNLRDLKLQLCEYLTNLNNQESDLHDDLVSIEKLYYYINKSSENSNAQSVANISTHKLVEEKSSILKNGLSSDYESMEEKLKQWKKSKRDKFTLEDQAKKIKVLNKIEMEKLQAKKRSEIKAAVKEWKDTKLAQVQDEKLNKELCALKEKEIRSTKANKALQKFRSKDEIYVQKMLQRKHNAEGLISRSENNFLKPKNAILRDPNRLMQPTKQWLSRCADIKMSKGCNALCKSSCSVVDIPKLGVPQWIQHKEHFR